MSPDPGVGVVHNGEDRAREHSRKLSIGKALWFLDGLKVQSFHQPGLYEEFLVIVKDCVAEGQVLLLFVIDSVVLKIRGSTGLARAIKL